MKFIIKRTSKWSDDEQPCEEAVPSKVPHYDERTFKSFEAHDKQLKEVWTSRGTEHKLLYGPLGGVIGISRRLEDIKAWEIEINTLEELMTLYNKYGELIINTPWSNHVTPQIEIYDDYRE